RYMAEATMRLASARQMLTAEMPMAITSAFITASMTDSTATAPSAAANAWTGCWATRFMRPRHSCALKLAQHHIIAAHLHFAHARQIGLAEQRHVRIGEHDAIDVVDQLAVHLDAVDAHVLAANGARRAFADHGEVGGIDRNAEALRIVDRQRDDIRTGVDDEMHQLAVDLGVGVEMAAVAAL